MQWISEGGLRSIEPLDEMIIERNYLTVVVGKLKGYEKMVTGRISVEDIVEKGFKELINNKDKHIKIMVSPKKSFSA